MPSGTFLCFQVRQELRGHPNRTVQVDVDLASKALEIKSGLMQIDLTHYAGAVDKYIERRKFADYIIIELSYCDRIAHIAFERMDTR